MSLKGQKILITAGPTREYLDPVRYLSNDSSGEMGYQIAEVLQRAGAHVTVLSGPTPKRKELIKKSRFKIHSVTTALQMAWHVKKRIPRTDVFIATAAVSDFRFQNQHAQKIKKGSRKSMSLKLKANPDILKETSQWKIRNKKRKPLLVGFSLETEKIGLHAKKKLKKKNLDLIIGNSPISFSSSKIKPVWIEKREKSEVVFFDDEEGIGKEDWGLVEKK